MIFIFLLALILFGPKRLPEIARQVGKFMAEFKRASNDFKYQLQAEIDKAGAPAPAKPQAQQQSPSTAPVLLPPAAPMSATSLPQTLPGNQEAAPAPSPIESEHERLMRTARMAFDAQNFTLRPPEPPPVAHSEPPAGTESNSASAESTGGSSPSHLSSSPAEAVAASPVSGPASPAGSSAS